MHNYNKIFLYIFRCKCIKDKIISFPLNPCAILQLTQNPTSVNNRITAVGKKSDDESNVISFCNLVLKNVLIKI